MNLEQNNLSLTVGNLLRNNGNLAIVISVEDEYFSLYWLSGLLENHKINYRDDRKWKYREGTIPLYDQFCSGILA